MSETRYSHPVDAWDERLAALVEGSASTADAALIRAHAAACPICAARLAALESIDRDFRSALAGELPGSAFDRAVLARIASFEREAAAARQLEVTAVARSAEAQIASLRRRLGFDILLHVLGGIGVVVVGILLWLHARQPLDAALIVVADSVGPALPAIVAAAAAAVFLVTGTGYALARDRDLI